jgi:hypothetical protein
LEVKSKFQPTRQLKFLPLQLRVKNPPHQRKNRSAPKIKPPMQTSIIGSKVSLVISSTRTPVKLAIPPEKREKNRVCRRKCSVARL